MSAFLEVQGAIQSKLTSNVALMSLITGVYDDVPQAAQSESLSGFPFVVIGDDSFTGWDTDTETGFMGTLVIHTWSRYRGKQETKRIQGAVYDALNRATLTTQSFTIMDIQFDSAESFVDADGLTRHGLIKFTIWLEAN